MRLLWYILFMPHVKRNTGIYCIENLVNGKKYIGQAHNIERRLYEHEYYLKKGADKATSLQLAVNKYGIENFSFYILETCEPDRLSEREVYYIYKFGTNKGRNGYNRSSGGESGLFGYRFPDWVGRKISMAKKGMKISEEQKRKISQAQKGKVLSEETKRKISEGRSGEKHYLWGKNHTKESKAKMSEAHKGE